MLAGRILEECARVGDIKATLPIHAAALHDVQREHQGKPCLLHKAQ